MNIFFGGSKHKKDADEATVDRPAASLRSSAGSSHSPSRGEDSEAPVSSGTRGGSGALGAMDSLGGNRQTPGTGIGTSPREENLIVQLLVRQHEENRRWQEDMLHALNSLTKAVLASSSSAARQPEPGVEAEREDERKRASREKKKRKPDSLHVVIYSSSPVEHKQAQALSEYLIAQVPGLYIELCTAYAARPADVAIVLKRSEARIDMPEESFLKQAAQSTRFGNAISVKALQSNDPATAPYSPKPSQVTEYSSGIGLKLESPTKAIVFLSFNFPLMSDKDSKPFLLRCKQNDDNFGALVDLLRKAPR